MPLGWRMLGSHTRHIGYASLFATLWSTEPKTTCSSSTLYGPVGFFPDPEPVFEILLTAHSLCNSRWGRGNMRGCRPILYEESAIPDGLVSHDVSHVPDMSVALLVV